MPILRQREVQPPCQAACPAGVRARDYVALIGQGRYLDAFNLIRDRMPFPSACGRICYHPCETDCNRGLVDEPVAIMYLKRFASDYAFYTKNLLPLPIARPGEKKVAIIGAGPCGLTAAQNLTRAGYLVTIFEALPFAGGTLRAALPKYRLPRELLDWDIQNILALGIKLNVNVAMGEDLSLDELRQDRFNAILLATSTDRSRKLSRYSEGIIAEGDLAFGHIWTVHAVAAGHKAAILVEHYLQGKSPPALDNANITVARRDQSELQERVKKGNIKLHPRANMPVWQPEEALKAVEMDLGYSEEAALQEAQRCLGCGAAEVIEEKCTSCLTCRRVCPYEAPVITRTGLLEIQINRCQACGLCIGECPARALAFTMPGTEDITSRMEAVLTGPMSSTTELRILGLYCSYGALANRTFTELIKTKPTNIGIITIPCVAKIRTEQFLKAFELGADGILVAGCLEKDCPYEQSVFWVRRRVETTKKLLAEIGLGVERLEMYNVLGSEQFANTVEGFIQKIGQLGPSPMKKAGV